MSIRRHPAGHMALLTLLALAAAGASGIAFAMWNEHSAGIFMTLVEAGMSWCF